VSGYWADVKSMLGLGILLGVEALKVTSPRRFLPLDSWNRVHSDKRLRKHRSEVGMRVLGF